MYMYLAVIYGAHWQYVSPRERKKKRMDSYINDGNSLVIAESAGKVSAGNTSIFFPLFLHDSFWNRRLGREDSSFTCVHSLCLGGFIFLKQRERLFLFERREEHR